NTCHVKGAKKNVRNAYGEELAKLIEGNAAQRIKAPGANKNAIKAAINKEADKAMKKVETMDAPGGGTYGDLFKAGKLPE
ncbi:MAG: hypothetical protein NXI22_21320, partial [bacterium]|nr:hypothetical protein [bacterium]